MTTYTVDATKSGQWWALQCREFPGAISQVRHLSEAEIITEAISWIADVPESEVEIQLVPKLPAEIEQHVTEAERLRRAAAQANSSAAAERQKAAAALRDAGIAYRDIGQILGVSHQRAHQLVKAAS
ncbi:MAG: hypothetical protein ACOYBP_05180 [Microbacteriaceae bacterium]